MILCRARPASYKGEKIYTGFVLGIIASSTVLITARSRYSCIIFDIAVKLIAKSIERQIEC